MSRQIRVEVKPGVILWPAHFHFYHVGLILRAVENNWPEESDLIVITRGAEPVPTGKPNSKHLTGKALDFRTRHLPPEMDRTVLLHRIMGDPPMHNGYYGYFKKIPDGKGGFIEWMHIDYRR